MKTVQTHKSPRYKHSAALITSSLQYFLSAVLSKHLSLSHSEITGHLDRTNPT